MKFEPVFTKVVNEGEYRFKITGAIDSTSRSGDEMLKLTFAIQNDLDKGTVYVNFNAKRAGFLRSLSEAIGLVKEYESGAMVAEQFLNKTGKCHVIVKEDEYGKKNDICKFMPGNKDAVDMQGLGEDVPF